MEQRQDLILFGIILFDLPALALDGASHPLDKCCQVSDLVHVYHLQLCSQWQDLCST